MTSRDTRRLSERFSVGDRVEIFLRTFDGERWEAATVIHHQPPGIWVESDSNHRWYVTNGRRIRPAAEDADG